MLTEKVAVPVCWGVSVVPVDKGSPVVKTCVLKCVAVCVSVEETVVKVPVVVPWAFAREAARPRRRTEERIVEVVTLLPFECRRICNMARRTGSFV